MKREDIPGQETLKEVFAEMVDNQELPHAILIKTKRGGSGLAMALYLTQYMFCEQKTDGDPCGECPKCKKLQSLTHPDVHFILPVNKRKNERKQPVSDEFLEQWREIVLDSPYFDLMDWYEAIGIEKKQGFMGTEEVKELRHKMSLRSFEGKQKVFIIWQADRMNTEFANKILKNLEEPSADTHFILVTESPSRLLPTVLSRSQIFPEEPTTFEQIRDFLKWKFELTDDEAMNIAYRSEGNLAQAIKDMNHTGDQWLAEFRQFMRMAYMRDLKGLYEWSDAMSKHSRDAQKQFIQQGLSILDRTFRLGWLNDPLPFEGEEANFYKKFAPYVNHSNVKGLMEDLERASYHIERNLNQKVVWYDTAINAIRLVHQGRKAVEES